MREFIKRAISKIDPSYLERALSTSLMTNKYAAVRKTKWFPQREGLWQEALDIAGSGPVTYLEFGVFSGISIRYFCENNANPGSTFTGFDSFIGLPEDWNALPKGTFGQDGNIPQIDDKRVNFVKGWFQNSVPPFIAAQGPSMNDTLIVHYDADLYSSTLFCLAAIDVLKKPYLAIFDEFMGDETRALYNYCQMSGADVEFLGWNGEQKDWPWRALCRISPKKVFEV